VLCFMVVILERFEFQRRLGAVYTTLCDVRNDLAVFLAVYFYMVCNGAVLLNILVGPYYERVSSLYKAVNAVAESNVVGSQGEMAQIVLNIVNTVGMDWFQALPIYAVLYILPVLLMWVMFSLLFAIIGDAFNDIKEGFGHTPTVLADLEDMMACSALRVDRFKAENRTKALVERCHARMHARTHRRLTESRTAIPSGVNNTIKTGVLKVPSGTTVYVESRHMRLKELRRHIGQVLREDFDSSSGFFRNRAQPDKHHPTMAEFAQGMGNACLRESEQSWSLFHNPLLQFRNGALPPGHPDSLSVKGKLGGPSVQELERREKAKKRASHQATLNLLRTQMDALGREVTAARLEMTARWLRVYQILRGHYFAFLPTTSTRPLSQLKTKSAKISPETQRKPKRRDKGSQRQSKQKESQESEESKRTQTSNGK